MPSSHSRNTLTHKASTTKHSVRGQHKTYRWTECEDNDASLKLEKMADDSTSPQAMKGSSSDNSALADLVWKANIQWCAHVPTCPLWCGEQMWVRMEVDRACAAAGSLCELGRSHVGVNSLAPVPGREWMTWGRVAHPWRCLSGDVPPFCMFTLTGATLGC